METLTLDSPGRHHRVLDGTTISSRCGAAALNAVSPAIPGTRHQAKEIEVGAGANILAPTTSSFAAGDVTLTPATPTRILELPLRPLTVDRDQGPPRHRHGRPPDRQGRAVQTTADTQKTAAGRPGRQGQPRPSARSFDLRGHRGGDLDANPAPPTTRSSARASRHPEYQRQHGTRAADRDRQRLSLAAILRRRATWTATATSTWCRATRSGQSPLSELTARELASASIDGHGHHRGAGQPRRRPRELGSRRRQRHLLYQFAGGFRIEIDY